MRDNTDEISALTTAPKSLLERHLCSVDGTNAVSFNTTFRNRNISFLFPQLK